jgi:CRP-like cAMP-binding protein
MATDIVRDEDPPSRMAPAEASATTRTKSGRARLVKRRVSPENHLLAAVFRKQRRQLTGLEPVTLIFGDVLYEPGDSISHVYFPGASLVSLLTLADGHLALEVGLIGLEGMVGIPLVLGHRESAVRALVQGGGSALRMESGHFMNEFQLNACLRDEVYRYTHTLMAQISQTAACNRFHVVEERLARWLLMTRDRVRSNNFPMTQEFLSTMLGVRRVGVTKAAGQLQRLGLIEYHRGNISIIEAAGLEAAACSCYRVVRELNEPAPHHARRTDAGAEAHAARR